MTNELGRLNKERTGLDRLGIFEETSILRRNMMWGAPGAECALAQLLPAEVSCFYEQFNVAGARSEFNNTLELLKKTSPKLEIILVKDLFAQMVRRQGLKSDLNLSDLLAKLDGKADEFYDKYKIGDSDHLKQVKTWMRDFVNEDVEKYGEKEAIYMNDRLANFEGLPMANVLYARDQSNLAGNVWIWSSMRHEIRQPEVALYKEVIRSSGILGDNIIQVEVNEKGRFEGGDLIVSGGICYIGVGGRTTLEGIKQIAPTIIKNGLPVVIVYDERRDKGLDGEMDVMHLDTFAMPIDENTFVACSTEVDRRTVKRVTLINGEADIKDWGPLSEFLKMREIDLVEITKEEQEKHASNFVNLGFRTAILTLLTPDLSEKLRKQRLEIHNADLQNITDGYGGLHCMSAPIERG